MGTAQYLSPGAGPRRVRRRPQRPLLDRRAALRTADRSAAFRATRRWRSPTSTSARTRRRRRRWTRTCRRISTPSCMRALAKNPDNRYQSAAEMREDIERAMPGQKVLATPVLPAPVTDPAGRAPRRRRGSASPAARTGCSPWSWSPRSSVPRCSPAACWPAREATVPNLVNATQDAGRRSLRPGSGLDITGGERRPARPGHRAEPGGRNQVDQDTPVDLVLSGGPGTRWCRRLRAHPGEATRQLQAMQLQVATRRSMLSKPAGHGERDQHRPPAPPCPRAARSPCGRQRVDDRAEPGESRRAASRPRQPRLHVTDEPASSGRHAGRARCSCRPRPGYPHRRGGR